VFHFGALGFKSLAPSKSTVNFDYAGKMAVEEIFYLKSLITPAPLQLSSVHLHTW
jgi:hypothetical protein